MIPGGIVSTLFTASSVASAVDAFFNRTALILTGETSMLPSYLATNANSTFLDQGSNNFIMTGTTTTGQTSFSPFSTSGYSFMINGSGNAVSVPTSTLSLNYHGKKTTIEFWVFPRSYSTANSGYTSLITNQNNTGALGQVAVGCYNTTGSGTATIGLYSAVSNSGIYSTGTITAGQWNHVVIQVDVTTPSTTNELIFFINGAKETKTINFSTLTAGGASTSPLQIGGNGYSSNYLDGYISSVRIVQGANYVYNSGTIVPPTSPLARTANTVLLTATRGSFFDEVSKTTLGVVGTPISRKFSPFSPVNSYNSLVPTKSMYISGANRVDYPNHTSLNLGSNDFTIDFWMNLKAASSGGAVICRGARSYMIGILTGTLCLWMSSDGANWDMANTLSFGTVNVDRWYHVAVSRIGSTMRLFLNGQLVQTVAVGTSSIFDNSATTTIGYWNGSSTYSAFQGLLQDVRIIKGTGLYSAAFVPPTTQSEAITGTSLLVCKGSLDDQSANARVPTVTGVPYPSSGTPITPLGNSINFTGTTGSYLQLGGQSNFAFGTGDFTIEFMIKFNSTTTNQQIYSSQNSGAYVTAPDIWLNTTGKLNLQVAGTGAAIAGVTTLLPHVWYHVALVRSSGSTRLFLNGEQEGSTYTDNNNYVIGTGRPIIGSYGYNVNVYPLNANISDIRVVKGTAVYTGSRFAPPSSSPTDIAGTSLLVTNAALSDSSSNKFALTQVGTVKSTIGGGYGEYAGAGSYFFNGAAYAQIEKGSNFSLTGDFTIEGWVMMPTTTNGSIFTMSSVSSSGWDYDDSNARINGLSLATTSLQLGTGAAISFGSSIFEARKWQHFAVVRSGTALKIYVDGIEKYATTYSNAIGSSNSTPALGILDKYSGTARWYFTGHISNFRVVNGTALYSGAFTPPESALGDITNTKLLTCTTPRVGDSSAQNNLFTNFGVVSNKLSPFSGGVANSGSFIFDGVSHVTSPASTIASIFGTSSVQATTTFTMEAWIYQTQRHTDTRPVLMGDLHNSTGASAIAFGPNNTGRLTLYWWSGVAYTATGDDIIPLNTWTHIAVCSNGGALTLYVNGRKQTITGTSTLTNTTSGAGYFNLGKWYNGSTGYAFYGMVSDVHVARVAKYRDSFPLPTAPVTLSNESTLYLSGNGGTISDYAMNYSPVVTATNLSTSIVKNGKASIQFGATSVIDIPAENLLLNSQLTIEFWMRAAADSTQQVAFHLGDGTSQTNGIEIGKSTTNRLYLASATTTIGGAASSLPNNTWFHVAVVKNGTSWTVYQDGVQVDTSTTLNGTITGTASKIKLGGRYGTTTVKFNGYIDDLRVTTAARYTANFTPPTNLLLK